MVNPRNYPSSKKNELIESAIDWINAGHKVVLLSLISVEGNSPYPVGTQMLVRDDGEYIGQITGGCVETSLVEQALMVIRDGKNIVERYGLNSRFFDIKLPCGSGLDIEFNVQTSLDEYVNIAEKLSQRQPVTKSDIKTYFPTPRILLFGQGPIVQSLIEVATMAGFDVLLFDHQQKKDFTGSKKTHEIRLEKLTELGISETELEKIHGPIGLDINSRTPEQIAISVIAQIISVHNGNES